VDLPGAPLRHRSPPNRFPAFPSTAPPGALGLKLLCGKWKNNGEWFFKKEIWHSSGDGMLYLFLRGRRKASCAGREYFTGGDDEAKGRPHARVRERFTAVVMRPSSRKRAAAEK
jgi:hypothetical protein